MPESEPLFSPYVGMHVAVKLAGFSSFHLGAVTAIVDDDGTVDVWYAGEDDDEVRTASLLVPLATESDLFETTALGWLPLMPPTSTRRVVIGRQG